MDFSAVKRVYFVGVGGVGVNALAKFAADFGIDVCGSDAKINDLCKELIKNGARISENPDFSLLEKSDFLVFSSAIPKNNPELVFAKKRVYLRTNGTNFLRKFRACSARSWRLRARTAKQRLRQCSPKFF